LSNKKLSNKSALQPTKETGDTNTGVGYLCVEILVSLVQVKRLLNELENINYSSGSCES
jgi:hypothetical protein